MRSAIFSLIFLLGPGLLAASKETHNQTHREHQAHVHGAGKLGIAFDENKGQLDLRIPSESIFGFEHTARSEKDKKLQQEGLTRLESHISEIVVFAPELKCQISKEKISAETNLDSATPGKQTETQSEHGDTIATFKVICERSPLGTKMTFNFQKFFPRIMDLDIDLLIGTIQRSAEAKQNGTTLELK